MFGPDEAHVWCVSTGHDAGDGGHLEWLLSDSEWARRSRLVSGRARRDYTSARALLRVTLSMYARRLPWTWSFDKDEIGGASVANTAGAGSLQCDVGYAQGLVACAVSSGSRVGIKVEHVRDVPVDYLYDRCLSSEERSEVVRVREASAARERLAELWALKQALRNAADLSGRVSPSTLSFRLPRRVPVLVERPACLGERAFRFALYEPTPGHRIAVALEVIRSRPPRICARTAEDGRAIPMVRKRPGRPRKR